MNYPWQQLQWQSVQQQREQSRLPHALLLNGPVGIGKHDFARALARQVLCERGSADEACACRECQLFEAGHHPDFYTVSLQEKSQVIKVDQIRELNERLSQTAHRGGHQVVIITPVEKMNRASANALLKTLEEPMGSVQFLLIAHQLGSLPSTIVSRCQKIHFTLRDQAQAIEWLRQRLTDSSQAELLLRLADDAPLRAIELEQQNFLTLRDDVLKRLMNILQEQSNPIASVGDIVKGDVLLFLHALLSIVLDIVRLRLGVTTLLFAREDSLRSLMSLRSVMQWMELISRIQNAQRLLQGSTHVNVQLLIEDLLIEIKK